MPGATTNLHLPYPNGTEAPDGPGAVQPLANYLEQNTLAQGGWAPSYGGDSGATVGANGGTNGFFYYVGRAVHYRGRVLFGSSAIAGGGVLTGFNLGGVNDTGLSGGRGLYVPSSGSPVEVVLRPLDTSEWAILVASNGAAFSSLGNPPQSSQLFFEGVGIIPSAL